MAKKQTQTYELKRIAKELGIDVPILNTKISGNKLILYLYGGRVVEYPLQPQEKTAKKNKAPAPATAGEVASSPKAAAAPAQAVLEPEPGKTAKPEAQVKRATKKEK
jgi:hypothetical protein